MLPLLSDLNGTTTKEIISAWNRLLFNFRLRDAKENGERTKALLTTLMAFYQGVAKIVELGNIVIWALPCKLKQPLKKLRSYLKSEII